MIFKIQIITWPLQIFLSWLVICDISFWAPNIRILDHQISIYPDCRVRFEPSLRHLPVFQSIVDLNGWFPIPVKTVLWSCRNARYNDRWMKPLWSINIIQIWLIVQSSSIQNTKLNPSILPFVELKCCYVPISHLNNNVIRITSKPFIDLHEFDNIFCQCLILR